MSHNELLDKIYWYWRRDNRGADGLQPMVDYRRALLKVVYLHKPQVSSFDDTECAACSNDELSVIYPCPTIQAIEKELE
jgi:hypothetical protein